MNKSLAKIEQLKGDYQNLCELKNNNFEGLENKEAVYAIWWEGDTNLLRQLNRKANVKGKKISTKEKQQLGFSQNSDYLIHPNEWDFDMELNLEKPCLYVGKTHSIKKRIKLHLLSTKEQYFDSINEKDDNIVFKSNTSSQVRAGIEHLFRNLREYKLDDKLLNFSLSYFFENDFKERFYLEDLAVGYFRPWFNLDSER